jgi:hypothetical protein
MEPAPDLTALIESIAEDPELLRTLSAEITLDGFVAACVAAAELRNLRVTAAEVSQLVRARGIRWLERNAR